MGSHSLLQGNLPSPGIEPRFLLHCRLILLHCTTLETHIPWWCGSFDDEKANLQESSVDKASESCPPPLLASCPHLSWVFGRLCPIYYVFSARVWTYSPNVVQCHWCCPVASLTREGLCRELSKDFTGGAAVVLSILSGAFFTWMTGVLTSASCSLFRLNQTPLNRTSESLLDAKHLRG